MTSIWRVVAFGAVVVALVMAAGCATDTDTSLLASEYAAIGAAWGDLGKFDKAALYYEKAAGYGNKSTSVTYNRVMVLIELAQYDKAESLLQELESMQPDNTLLREARAFLFLKRGDNESALAAYQDLYENSVRRQSVVVDLFLLYKSFGRDEDAWEVGQALSAITQAQVLLQVALTGLKLGHEKEAWPMISSYRTLVKDAPDKLLALAHELEGLAFYAQSLEIISGLLEKSPNDSELHFWHAKGLALLDSGSPDARTELELILKSGFKNASLLNGLLKAVKAESAPLFLSLIKKYLPNFASSDSKAPETPQAPAPAPPSSPQDKGSLFQ